MNQKAYMKCCPTLDMIGDYFMEALQQYKYCCFCNIIIGIHEDDTPSYNAPRGALLE